MKNLLVNKAMDLIVQNNDYNETQLEEIRYGLISVYLTFSKLIVISLIAIVLGIFKEMLILLIIYNILRSYSFGLHASKSWVCLLVSSIIFIGGTILCINITINKIIIALISLITICIIYKYSPADTKKRPIVNPTRRKVFKFLSTIIAMIFYTLSLFLNNNFITNCLLLSLIIQSIMIHPLTYKLFNMSYDNYKSYKTD